MKKAMAKAFWQLRGIISARTVCICSMSLKLLFHPSVS
jgi:hypothetical protein